MSALFLGAMILCLSPVVTSAKENKGLEVSFDELSYSTHDYDGMNVTVEHEKVGNKEIATVKDQSGKVLEVSTLEPEKAENNIGSRVKRSAGTISSHILTRNKKFGKTTLGLRVTVELWSQGSFRQINSVKGKYLGITTSVTDMKIEGKSVNVWSPNGFPTTRLLYGYSGTLVATVTSSTSASATADLKGAGFTYSYSASGKKYYRLAFDEAGELSIY